MGSFSLIHWIILGVVILLLFGGNRFSAMMSDVAKGLKNFKQGLSEEDKPGDSADQRRDQRSDHRSDPRQLPPQSGRDPIDVTPRRAPDPVPPSSPPTGDETSRE
jgi:sec-independent protein translocase protein TatA